MANDNPNSDDPSRDDSGVESKETTETTGTPKSVADVSPTTVQPPDTGAGGVSSKATDAERIARLQDDLLDASQKAPQGVMDIVSQLRAISPDADICPRDHGGDTPLHHLVRDRHAKPQTITEFLGLLSEEQVNAVSASDLVTVRGSKNTALHLAACHGATDAAKALLDAGADSTIQNDRLYTALHLACASSHTQPAKNLCEHGIQHHINMDVPDSRGYTPLHHACEHDLFEVVELLLSHLVNADAERRTSEGETPLMLVARWGSYLAAKHLINHSVDLDAVGGPYESTALIEAAKRERHCMVMMLLRAKAVVDRRDGDRRTALSWASYSNNAPGVVQMLLNGGADVNTQGGSGDTTPLQLAAGRRSSSVVKVLLENGAHVNKQNERGITALYSACFAASPEVVKILLESHADPLVLREDGRSVLHAAIKSPMGGASVVEILLNSARGGELLNLAEFEGGYSPLHYASMAIHLPWRSSREGPVPREIMQTLLRYGADTSARTRLGLTALHVTVMNGMLVHVHILLDHMRPEDITATTNDGKTALDIAVGERYRQTASILLQRSACGLGKNKVDDAVVSWACEDASTHGIVRLKLLRDVGTAEGIKPEWGALDVAAHLGDYIVVQKLLRGLSRTEKGLEEIQHAIGVVDAVQKTTRDVNDTSTDPDLHDTQQPIHRHSQLFDTEKSGELSETSGDDGVTQRPAKDPSRDPSFRFQAVRTLLRVAENSARTSTTAEDLRPPAGGVDANFGSPAAIFDFHSSGGATSTVMRHVAPVRRVIYNHGPARIMRERREGEEKARSMLELLVWPEDEHSQALKKEALLELNPGRDQDLRIRWIHLPANNMRWMNDLMTRILYDRAGPGTKVTEAYKSDIVNKNDVYDSRPDNVAKYDHLTPGDGELKNKKEIEPSRYDPDLPGLRSFFSRSWIEFPDSSSMSRVMKARCAKKRATASERAQPRPVSIYSDEPPRSPGASSMAQDKGDGQPTPPKKDEGSEPLALYMPYLTFAKQEPSMTANSMRPFTDKSQVVHGSRTLDEFYYQFASDREYDQADIDKRNRDQVVTRWLHRGEDIDKLESWIVLRVDQLWLWIVAPDVIITSSTHRLDGRPDVVSSRVFSHLQKGHSQPKTAHELADLITTICIRFYDQVQETAPEESTKEDKGEHDASREAKTEAARERGGLTIQEIFSNSINKVAIEEVELFDTFTKDEEVTNDDAARPLATKKATVVKPARLLCEVKDLQDEINILRAIVAQQQRVQDAFLGEEPSEGSMTGQIIARIDDMDKYAARIYSAVHATLGLEQNKIAIGYSNEAVRQGRNLMAFTATTILFLPLSFLASLFALEVTSFPHKENGDVSFSPQWIFPLIFLISAAFWVLVILYAFHDRMAGLFELQLVQNMRRWGRNITRPRRETAEPDTQSEVTGLKSVGTEDEIQFKPRGLQRMGLRWRRRRGVYTEEDAISTVELNGVPRRPELGKKQMSKS